MGKLKSSSLSLKAYFFIFPSLFFFAACDRIFSGGALNTLNDCEALSRVVATNTVPFAEKRKQCSKLEEIDVSPTLAESIRRTHNGESVSFLFSHAPME